MGLSHSRDSFSKSKCFVWNVEDSYISNYECAISPEFIQEQECFVGFYSKAVSSLFIYCCSAMQWHFDEIFCFRVKINYEGIKLKTTATFSRISPFCCVILRKVPLKIDIGISLPTEYPYTRSDFYVGIRNSGSTCYIASSLQVLFHIGSFRQFLFSFKEPPDTMQALQHLFVELQLSSRAPSLDPLIRTLGSVNDIACSQQDAHEFIIALFERLGNDIGPLFEEGIDHLFGIESQIIIKSKLFSSDIVNKEKSLMIPVTVEGFQTLVESLSFSILEEEISGQNSYIFEDKKVEATKSLRYSKLPPILIFQLCRFKYSKEEKKVVELRNLIDCPFELDMRPFIGDCQIEDTQYEMFAIISHCGDPQQGHYISNINTMMSSKWMLFDDSKTSSVSIDEISKLFDDKNGHFSLFHTTSFGSPLPYIVFYVRKDCYQFIISNHSIPIHLAPHRSDIFYSEFVFHEEMIGLDINGKLMCIQWEYRYSTFKEILERNRSDISLDKKTIWARLPGKSMFVGPLSIYSVASSFIIKGLTTVFFVLSDYYEQGPLFLVSQKPPRKYIAIANNSDLFSVKPEGYILQHKGRVLEKPSDLSDLSVPPGSTIILKDNKNIFLRFGSHCVVASPLTTYKEIQTKIAVSVEQPASKILLCIQHNPLKPHLHPIVSLFPDCANLNYQILEEDITVNSLKLHRSISVFLIYNSIVQKTHRPFWIPKNWTCKELVLYLPKIFPDIKFHERMLIQFSKGTPGAVSKLLMSADYPLRSGMRCDIVRKEIPFSRAITRDLIKKKVPFSIELRLLTNIGSSEYSGTSRFVTVNPTTTARDICKKVSRFFTIGNDSQSTIIIFLSDKPSVYIQLNPDEPVYPQLKIFSEKMTSGKQRLCFGLINEELILSLDQNPHSLSGIIKNPKTLSGSFVNKKGSAYEDQC